MRDMTQRELVPAKTGAFLFNMITAKKKMIITNACQKIYFLG